MRLQYLRDSLTNSRHRPRRHATVVWSPNVATAAFVALSFSSVVKAQDNNNDNDNKSNDNAQDKESNDDQKTTEKDETSQKDEEKTTTTKPTTTSTKPAKTSAKEDDDDRSPDDTDDEPLPSITGGFRTATYPPPSVPPVADAPYMHRSTMPEGSVFIIVGTILGAFGLALLVWRGIVALLLHRSVERAAKAQTAVSDKATFAPPNAAFYQYSDQDQSAASLGKGGVAGVGVRRTNRGNIPSTTPSMSNLFYSPTAARSSIYSQGNRDSRYMAPGFYASGANAGSSTHVVSMTNLAPEARNSYVRGSTLRGSVLRDPSPEGSPRIMARRDVSTSSISLAPPTMGRTPSAFLDDLLDDNPLNLPPQSADGESSNLTPPPNPKSGSSRANARNSMPPSGRQ